MVGLNNAGSFLVAYSNYEIVQKSVEGRLSQQMVRNDSLLMTLFDCFGHYSRCRSKLWFWNCLEAKWSENTLRSSSITKIQYKRTIAHLELICTKMACSFTWWELNDAESFFVDYSNYETVQKNVERRLSQQIVRNDSLFVTIFDQKP